MRISHSLCFLLLTILPLASAEFCFAQETDFPVGPQYLAPAGAIVLQPIATPTSTSGSALGLPQPPAVETSFPAGPQYLVPSGSPLFLHPIATPSMSFPSGLTELATTETVELAKADDATTAAVDATLGQERKDVLYSLYYGIPRPNVIEIAFTEASAREAAALPSSIVDVGVVQFITPQALAARGYGVTVAEAAARSRSQKRAASHIFTNEDIERLRSRQ